MPIRRPAVAGQFYPARRNECIRMIEESLPDSLPPDLPDQIEAGIVPHAGWAYSGPTAAQVFAAIQAQRSPQTFILLSAMHRRGAVRPAIYARGAWATPLGEAPIDEELAQTLLDQGGGTFVDKPEAHTGEHSAEVQVPFIQHLFPDARILPIMLPPEREAVEAGKVIARAMEASEKDGVVIGTTDLTHYGTQFYGFAPAGTGEEALEWVRANDRRVIDLMLQMKAEKVLPETAAHRNACGGGAIAATIAAARDLGAKEGTLLEYTTSHDVMPRGPAANFVGYAAVVWGHQ